MLRLKFIMIAHYLIFFLVVGYSHAIIKCPYFCLCDKWKDLRRVTCIGQRLASSEINAPPEVQALDLSINSIAELKDKGFHHAHHLRYLNVSHNKITDIHMNALYGLNELNILDMSHNHLKYLWAYAFEDTPKLQELYLSGNEIGHFGKPPVFQIPSLQILHMKECWLDSMDEATFSHLPNLIDLDLSNNQFVFLREEYIKSLKNLNSLNLQGNPWHCSNVIEEVVIQLTDKNVIVTPICETDKVEVFMNSSDMFGKIISKTDDSKSDESDVDNIETLDQDVSRIWFGDEVIPIISDDKQDNEEKEMNTLIQFVEQIPALWAFVLGLQIGAVIAIMGMWVWLRCKCSQAPAQPPMRTRSLSVTQSLRRSVGRHRSEDACYTELQSVDCPGTPPPPYRDIVLHTYG